MGLRYNVDIALSFTSQLQFFSLLCCPMRICVHCQKWHEDSFHWNRLLQSHSSLPCPGNLVINVFISSIYSFYCYYKCYFFFKSIPWNLLSEIPFSVYPFLLPWYYLRISSFSAADLVMLISQLIFLLPSRNHDWSVTMNFESSRLD